MPGDTYSYEQLVGAPPANDSGPPPGAPMLNAQNYTADAVQTRPLTAPVELNPENPVYVQNGDRQVAVPPDAYGYDELFNAASRKNSAQGGAASGAPVLTPDELLGFRQESLRPLHNMAQWMLSAGAGDSPNDPSFTPGVSLPQSPVTAEQEQQWYDKPVQDAAARGRVPGKMGATAGGFVGTWPIAAMGGEGVVPAMASGALSGALMTPDPHNAGTTAQSALAGLAGGALGYKATKAIGGLVAPTLSPEKQLLVNEGVKLTPGQLAGGAAQRIEDGLTSFPFLGDTIKNAQARGVESFNRAAINRSLAPIGKELPAKVDVGRDAVDYAHNVLSEAYGSVLLHLTVQGDNAFGNDLSQIVQQATSDLTPDRAQQLQNILKARVLSKFDANGNMSGEAMKDADSQLGMLARRYGKSLDGDQKALGSALSDAQQALRDVTMRSNPAVAPQLQAINTGWANLKRVEGAASSVAADGGVFSPKQLRAAVKAQSANPSEYARGRALMQDLSDAGSSVLPPTVPDSGSPFRHALEGFVAYGVGKESGLLKSPAALLGLAPSAAYSKPAMNFFNGYAAGGGLGPGANIAINKAAPAVGSASGSLLTQLSRQYPLLFQPSEK